MESRWTRSARHPGPDTVYTGEQLIESEQFRKTEFYNDYVVPNRIVRHFGSPLALHPRWVSNLSSHRPGNREPFGSVEIDLLKVLFPHLQRAIQLHRRFEELEGRHRASLEALNRLPVGVIMLDKSGRIVATNREAERLLHQNDGLFATSHGIRASGQNYSRELHGMIAGAAKTAEGEGTAAGGLLALPRPSGKRSLTVLVAPAGRNSFSTDVKTPSVILIVTDPEKKLDSLARTLARLYDLTAAESRVAELLMQGETVVRTAERLGVSHNTARTHLQRIYQKTNTSHQGDLIRVLVSGTPHLS